MSMPVQTTSVCPSKSPLKVYPKRIPLNLLSRLIFSSGQLQFLSVSLRTKLYQHLYCLKLRPAFLDYCKKKYISDLKRFRIPSNVYFIIRPKLCSFTQCPVIQRLIKYWLCKNVSKIEEQNDNIDLKYSCPY